MFVPLFHIYKPTPKILKHGLQSKLVLLCKLLSPSAGAYIAGTMEQDRIYCSNTLILNTFRPYKKTEQSPINRTNHRNRRTRENKHDFLSFMRVTN